MEDIARSPVLDLPVAASESQVARNVGVDAYRGFVMLLMMAEVLHLAARRARVPRQRASGLPRVPPDARAPGPGCSLHDLIQPSFSFLVGVALPFSIAAARRQGGSRRARMFGARALAVAAAGGARASSCDRWIGPQTNFTFEDTLTQIGLGYPLLFLLGLRSARVQWTALALILVGYWLAWALYPLPPARLRLPGRRRAARLAAPLHRPRRALEQERNLGAAFDQWFLNLFPRESPFVANGGGYLTLSFIPTLGHDDPGTGRRPVASGVGARGCR